MTALPGLPRGEGIPWPPAEQPARDLRTPPPPAEREQPFGIVIRPIPPDAGR